MADCSEMQLYVADPQRLLALCRQVVEHLKAMAGAAASAEKRRELKQVEEAITTMEKLGIKPPPELLAKRDRLLTEMRPPEEVQQALHYLQAEFANILSDLAMLTEPASPPTPKRQPVGKPHRLPLTHMEVFKEQIINALRQLGGRAEAAAVVEQVGKQLQGRLTPGDLKWSAKRGMYAWQHKTHWARYELTRDGVLKGDSPRGIWELSDKYQ